MRVFFSYCHHGYCNEVRGRLIGVDFSTFPVLNIEQYEESNGKGSAKNALQHTGEGLEPSDEILLDSYYLRRRFFPFSETKDMITRNMFLNHQCLDPTEKTEVRQLYEADAKSSNVKIPQARLPYHSLNKTWKFCWLTYRFEGEGQPLITQTCEKAIEHFKKVLQQLGSDVYTESIEISEDKDAISPFRSRDWRHDYRQSLEVVIDELSPFVEKVKEFDKKGDTP